jgi:uncharacterized membrane protein YphA (DoxX/SURF4 family)
MFYRLDYSMAVLLGGLLAGVVLGRPSAKMVTSRLARRYYVVMAVLLVVRTGASVGTMLLSHASLWKTASGLLGDLSGFLFGALFGLAVRRKDARELLTSSFVVSAMCMTLAFTFALNGIGKALSVAAMTEFFAQSGYSSAFLKFIMIAEVFGGIGLLLPWAVAPALIGLTIDMFGAVLTHIHNGDPLNDSTGAIGMLIRLIAVGVLWELRQRDGGALSMPTVRNSVLRVTAGAMACLLIAVGGSVAVRHLSPPPSAAASPVSR